MFASKWRGLSHLFATYCPEYTRTRSVPANPACSLSGRVEIGCAVLPETCCALAVDEPFGDVAITFDGICTALLYVPRP